MLSEEILPCRRKREMEVLEKECDVLEQRIQELRVSFSAILHQEEQLRLNQQTIRGQLAEGVKPDETLSLPNVMHPLPPDLTGRSEEEQAAFVAILSNQLGTLAGASMAMGAMNA